MQSSVSADLVLPDDATRPVAPPIEGVTPGQRAQGRRLALFHRYHLQELGRVRVAIDDLASGRGSAAAMADRASALSMAANLRQFGNLCGQECQALTMHHMIEDGSIFPQLHGGSEGLRKVVERLSAEHEVIHGLLVRFAGAAAAVVQDNSPENLERLRHDFGRLETFVRSHFGYEERELEEALGFYDVPL